MSNYPLNLRPPTANGTNPNPYNKPVPGSDDGSFLGMINQQANQANQQQWDLNHKPWSPWGQAQGLMGQEGSLLNRQAPAIGQVSNAGLAGARGNQMQALGAQQSLMAGPSLAGMKAQQAFGQAQQGMATGAANPLAQRAMMLGGNQQLGNLAQGAGNAVGQEMLQSQQGLANGTNTLGQGDLSSQNQMEALLQKQRQMYLQQRGQNMGQAQGYEQNYFNVQNAYTQQAVAAKAADDAARRAQAQAIQQDIAAGANVVGTTFTAGIKQA